LKWGGRLKGQRHPRWGIAATAKGRLLVRNIAMVFDKYLRADQKRSHYSKVL
jgi:oxygen-independent coproporphyrinogen III oxidase